MVLTKGVEPRRKCRPDDELECLHRVDTNRVSYNAISHAGYQRLHIVLSRSGSHIHKKCCKYRPLSLQNSSLHLRVIESHCLIDSAVNRRLRRH